MALKLDANQDREDIYDDGEQPWRYKPSQKPADAEDTDSDPDTEDEDTPETTSPSRKEKMKTGDQLKEDEGSADDSGGWDVNVGGDEDKKLTALQRARAGFSLRRLAESPGHDTSHKKHTSPRRKALIFGGAGGLGIIAILLGLIIFLGSLKAVHFATILRSTGFAGSQLVMRQAFSDIQYSNWAGANNTAELPRSSLVEKVFGSDMRKVQQKLAENGDFKYTLDESGKLNLDIRGKTLNLDELAQRVGAESYNDLTFREKLSVNKYVTDTVKFEIGDVFETNTRGFRNGFWKGFREATDIKMTAFRDVVRDKLGKKTVIEDLNNDETRLTDDYKSVRGEGGDVGSGIAEVQEGAAAVDDIIEANARKGIRVQTREALDSYLQTKGTDLASFKQGLSETANKVSTAVFVATTYCIAHDLSHTSDRLNRQMELSMARNGARIQTVSEQIQEGDVTSGDVKKAGQDWSANPSKKVPDAASTAAYQEIAYHKNVGNDPTLENAPVANMSLPLIDWLKPVDEGIRATVTLGLTKANIDIGPLHFHPGDTLDDRLDSLTTSMCGVVMNPYGQTAVLAADVITTIFSGGLTKALESIPKGVGIFLGFKTVGDIIQSYIEQASGSGVSGLEQGADKMNAGLISTDYLESQTQRGVTYGRPMVVDESAKAKELAMGELQDSYNQGSFKERYFAISNPGSFLSRVVGVLPSNLVSGAASIPSIFTSMASVMTQPLKLFSNIGQSKAFADSDQTFAKEHEYFGVNQWGWTVDEINTLKETDVFDNAAEVEQAIQNNPDYYRDLESCYSPNRLLYELAKDGTCSEDTLKSQAALKWRIYKLHSFAATQMSSEGINEN